MAVKVVAFGLCMLGAFALWASKPVWERIDGCTEDR
jgi:hypothetical protein